MIKQLLGLAIFFFAGYVTAMLRVQWLENGFAIARKAQEQREWDEASAYAYNAALDAARSAGKIVIPPYGWTVNRD